jgi:Na+/proline symporter
VNLNVTATIVFVILFLLVSWLGFVAAHWRKADLNQLQEWGLGGRRFGTVVTWFLLGGDLYTAYTFIAVPALVFGAGAMGFFAVAYAILIYPFLYLIYPRLWAIARERGHVTAADFVRDRFDSRLLALGSALALFLYPHAMTGVLSASSGDVIRRNSGLLAAYSFILGLIALLGFMAIAAGVNKDPAFAAGFKEYGSNFAVPALFLASFPSWFVGVAFAAIAIGALVPAAIMSIACANLYTRNIYKEFLKPDCTDAEEAHTAKVVSLVVKIGAVAFILAIPQAYAIQLQLLGGIWIIQLLPVVLLGLYTSAFNSRALLIGWAVGIGSGTYMAATQHFISSTYPLTVFGVTVPGYAALYSVVINVVVAALLTPILDRVTKRRPAHASD